MRHILVGAWVKPGVVDVGDGTDDDTANGPEHLQHLSGRGSQLDGYDLAAVCRRVGNEDTPWQTLEKLGHENKRKRIGEVKDEDEAIQGHETDQSRPTVSDPAGERSREEDANQGSELARHLKGLLPLGGDDQFSCGRVDDAVFVDEGR